MADNPYASQSISGYNASPPPDDDSTGSDNQVEWAKHKTKIGDPVKNLSEAIDTAVLSMGTKVLNNSADQANTFGGTIGWTSSELTVATGSITPTKTAHTVDTESDAGTDDLNTIATGSVSDGAIIRLTLANASRVTTVKNATGNVNLAHNVDVVLDIEVPLVLRLNSTSWEYVSGPTQNLTSTGTPTFESVSVGSVLINGQKRQSFTLNFFNNGGTLQHRLGAATGAATTGAFVDRISGADANFTNTPTGTDASTAMAAGGKLSSVNTNQFIFDTAAQISGDVIGQFSANQALIVAATIVNAQVSVLNSDVNGATLNRFAVTFTNAAGGAAWSPSSLAASDQLTVSFDGYIA